MKKNSIISLVLAMVMAFALCVPAFAASKQITGSGNSAGQVGGHGGNVHLLLGQGGGDLVHGTGQFKGEMVGFDGVCLRHKGQKAHAGGSLQGQDSDIGGLCRVFGFFCFSTPCQQQEGGQ